MKSQMQIVEDAISRLKKMPKEDFRESLIKAGAQVYPGYHPEPVPGKPLPPPKKP